MVWDDVPLNVSFRATRPILEAVDAVFARDPARAGVVAGDLPVQHLPVRGDDGGRVEIWPPLRPAGTPPPEPWKPPVEPLAVEGARSQLARLIARRIARWIADEEELPARGRPIEAADIMILVRRRDAFVAEVVRALKDEGVPVAGVDRMVLAEQIAVMDLVALGRFLLLPADDLTLACVLKSPLIGLDEDALFGLAYGRDGTLWAALGGHAGAGNAFGRAHALLDEVLSRTNFERPYELYAKLLATGGRDRLLARLGPDAADPIEEFLALALAYERTNTPSLEGFCTGSRAGAP